MTLSELRGHSFFVRVFSARRHGNKIHLEFYAIGGPVTVDKSSDFATGKRRHDRAR